MDVPSGAVRRGKDGFAIIECLAIQGFRLAVNPVVHPRNILSDLLNIFKAGLEKPLHFFPATSFVYVFQQQINDRSEKAAMDAARRNWFGNDYFRGESDDPYIDICFKSTDPLDSHFADISNAVLGPVLANGGLVELEY